MGLKLSVEHFKTAGQGQKVTFPPREIVKKDLKIRENFQFALTGNRLDDLLVTLGRLPFRRPPCLLVTLNTEFVMAARADASFYRLVNKADLVVPDGMGLVWALRVCKGDGFWSRLKLGLVTALKIILGRYADQRLAGVEVAEKLVALAAEKERTVYLLGGRPGVARHALKKLQARYPGLKGWASAGPAVVEEATPVEIDQVVGEVRAKKPDYLLVALGMVRQEKFIRRHLNGVESRLVMGVGGTFDYWAEVVPRVSPWVGGRGGEWLYRLVRQPWRWRRQCQLARFIWLVLTG